MTERKTIKDVRFKAEQVRKLYGLDEVSIRQGSKTYGWMFEFVRGDKRMQVSSWDIPCWTARDAHQFLTGVEHAARIGDLFMGGDQEA